MGGMVLRCRGQVPEEGIGSPMSRAGRWENVVLRRRCRVSGFGGGWNLWVENLSELRQVVPKGLPGSCLDLYRRTPSPF